MQYMMLLYLDAQAVEDPEAVRAATGEEPATDWVSYTDALARAGALVSGEGLWEPHTATTLAIREGRRLLTDGPFVETKDLLIGYYVIEVADLDAALSWAARLPLPGRLTVDVRPVRLSPASGAARLARS